MSDFERLLAGLLNAHSMENASNTPDFILAQYLKGCLETFVTAIQQRENWYGRDPRPSQEQKGDVELVGQGIQKVQDKG